MTEADWLACEEPDWMICSLEPRPSERKLRLAAVAGCDLLSELLTNPASAEAIRCAERYADGLASPSELESSMNAALAANHAIERSHLPQGGCTSFDENQAAGQPDTIAAWAAMSAARNDGTEAYWRMLEWLPRSFPSYDFASPARDIFGNPFRPVVFDPRWRTEAAVALAAGIYAERAFDRLPILADALEEAGCDHPDVLTHCRGPGPHVRGCWVVDLVLGKE